jgi:hypothetical protein
MASIVTNLLGGGIFQGVNGLIDRIKGKSPEDAAKLAELAAKYQSDILAADVTARQNQADVNKAEAASNSVFVAGWRPFIGWVCGSALAYEFVLRPLLTWAAELAHHAVMAPSLEMGDLLTLLLGMLGLGAMRTTEKINGINAGH